MLLWLQQRRRKPWQTSACWPVPHCRRLHSCPMYCMRRSIVTTWLSRSECSALSSPGHQPLARFLRWASRNIIFYTYVTENNIHNHFEFTIIVIGNCKKWWTVKKCTHLLVTLNKFEKIRPLRISFVLNGDCKFIDNTWYFEAKVAYQEYELLQN